MNGPVSLLKTFTLAIRLIYSSLSQLGSGLQDCIYYRDRPAFYFLQGWGCGYRSVQSLCSWAENKLRSSSSSSADTAAGGVVACVPSLRKIQEILVEVGDKPPSFVGSKQWIGSFEACIVLDHLFGVRTM